MTKWRKGWYIMKGEHPYAGPYKTEAEAKSELERHKFMGKNYWVAYLD